MGKVFQVQEKVDWEEFYAELTDDGKFFVDWWTKKYMSGFHANVVKRNAKLPNRMGEKGGRELALRMLQRFWNGELPEQFPTLVKVEAEE